MTNQCKLHTTLLLFEKNGEKNVPTMQYGSLINFNIIMLHYAIIYNDENSEVILIPLQNSMFTRCRFVYRTKLTFYVGESFSD